MQGFSKNLIVDKRQIEFIFLPVSMPLGTTYTVFNPYENSAFKIYQNGTTGWSVRLNELPEWMQAHEDFFIESIIEAQVNH